jgi:oligopeptidase B
MEHLRAEDAFAEAWMTPTKGLQKSLYDEMLARIQETDVSVPYAKDGFWYYVRTEKGRQYPILCRKEKNLEAAEAVLLDMNAMAEGHGFLALGEFEVSDDANTLLFSTDTTGYREYTLQRKDLRSGETSPWQMERVSSAAWAADNRTVFYVEDDPMSKRPFRLRRHTIGVVGEDPILHEEKDERFSMHVGRTRSRRFVVLSIASHTTSEVRILEADRAEGEFRTLFPRMQDIEYDVAHGGEVFYIRINDTGRNFRLVEAPVASPGRGNWTELVPHRPDVMLEAVDVFAGHYVLHETEDGLDRLRIVTRGEGEIREVTFPDPAYVLGYDVNAVYDSSTYRFRYQSPITPLSVFEFDLRTNERRLLKETPVLGGFDRTRYGVERLRATATDGEEVPITIAYRKDRRVRDGSMPMLLVGYGSYGYAYPASFSSSRVSLLDRGVVFAIAHIRGGGDLGKPWHDQGRMEHKPNTFTDFIACAEHLIGERWTSPDRLVIEGGSAGGLLMGAVVNLRPDLFRAVVSKVPFVDVINTMLDETLPLTVGEFEEWGNPKDPKHYAVMKAYCPYTNLKSQDYPAMLVKTSTEDSQVMFWEPAKYVARLREIKTDDNPVLLKINFAAGHGGASGRYDALREVAFDYAFMLTMMGAAEPDATSGSPSPGS